MILLYFMLYWPTIEEKYILEYSGVERRKKRKEKVKKKEANGFTNLPFRFS